MRSLKVFLAALIVGAVFPGVLFGIGTSWWLAHELRLNAQREAQATAEHTAANVAEHMRLVTAALRGLARSPALSREDLSEAYQNAAALAADLGQHIGLARADGQQLFNTRRPYGTPLPKRSNAVSYTRALESGEPSISDIIIGAITQYPLITIDIPVSTERGMRVLGTSTDLGAVGTVLERSRIRPGWVIAIVDGGGRFIARNVHPEQFVGKPAAPEVVAAAESDLSGGSFRNRTHQGENLISFFSKVPGTSWTVVVGMPEPVLFAPLKGSMAMLAAVGVAAMGLTLAVALTLGHRLDAAARRLTKGAQAMGSGAPLPPLSQSIAEFEQVEVTLHEAARVSRQREADLALARATAEESVAAKNRLFAAAGHDLRQPLQAATWCIDTLRQHPGESGKALEVLTQVHAGMAGLVDDLFEIARIDSDSVTPERRPVRLPDLLADLVTECRPIAGEKGLSLRWRTATPGEVVTDPALLARVIRNLVHNAIRYTERGGILIACRRRGADLVIEVHDTGIGIPADHQALIWGEFYQVPRGGAKKGAGLGLSIVWRLVRILGYRIELRSTPGKGSVFRVVIPGDG